MTVYGVDQEPVHGGDHGDLVAAMARFFVPRSYLEIGCYHGETMVKVFNAISHPCRIVGVDLSVTVARQRNGDAFGELVESDSIEYMKKQADASWEMVFLDASHELNATRDEVRESLRVLAPNGLLLMHDTYPPNEAQARPGYCGEAWRVADELFDEIRAEGPSEMPVRFELVTLPAQYGLTILRKRGPYHMPWKEPGR